MGTILLQHLTRRRGEPPTWGGGVQRREEVAQLAAISTDYYTRLEQGRIHPSGPVLASLAHVLRLDDD